MAIDFENTRVSRREKGGSWESLEYAHWSGDESHGATLSLWPSTSNKQGYNSFVNTKQQVKRSISVTKVWSDDENRDGLRKEVTVHLLRNGADTGKSATLGIKDGATAIFNDLDTYDLSTNSKYSYTIEEEVPEGYTAKVEEIEGGRFILTNDHAIDTVNIMIAKKWSGDSEHLSVRPSSVVVALLANGEEVKRTSIEEASDGTWSAMFSGLPKNAEGKAIDYTVKEMDVDTHYSDSVAGSVEDGFVVTNTYKADEASSAVNSIPAERHPAASSAQRTTGTSAQRTTGTSAQRLAVTGDGTTHLFVFVAAEGALLLAGASLLRVRYGKRQASKRS